MDKETIKSTIIKLLIGLIALLSVLVSSNISNAAGNQSEVNYGAWGGNGNAGMPSASVSSPTGLFPQKYDERNFTGKADTEYPYEEWKVEISKGTVYCDDSGAIVRMGQFDNNTYYPSGGQSMSELDALMQMALRNYAFDKYWQKGYRNWSVGNYRGIGYEQVSGPTDYGDRYALDPGATVFLVYYARWTVVEEVMTLKR